MYDTYDESGWYPALPGSPQPPAGSSFIVEWKPAAARILNEQQRVIKNFSGHSDNWHFVLRWKPLNERK